MKSLVTFFVTALVLFALGQALAHAANPAEPGRAGLEVSLR
jgi:hypothetical protein